MPRPRVFVVQPIPAEPLAVLEEVADVEVFSNTRRQISLQETIDGVTRADYLVALHGNFVPAEVIQANPNLRGISMLGGTTVCVDFDAALEARVPVAASIRERQKYFVGGGVQVATADLTIAMLLALAYRLLDADRYTRADATFQEQTMALMGQGCSTKTVGLVGLGSVGMHMIPRLRAFNMDLLYVKRNRLTPYEEQYLGLEFAPLEDLLARSDYVCVLVDYNPTTHEMIGAAELALMKPTAYLINTARGRIVDEPALIAALESGQIAGAGIEVFYDEPPRVWDPHVPEKLRTMDNVVLAPHNGGATYLSRSQQIMPVAEAVKMFIQGERPPGLLNPEVYGEEVLHPQLYGRGPIRPAVDGGLEDYRAF
jgi:phosphoglycerate dehydrogenase-like enzyme